MKKSSLLLVGFVLLAFALTTVVRRRSTEDSSPYRPADEDRQRIKIFWDTYQRANSLRFAGSFREAESAYGECLRLNPRHEDSLYYLGASQEALGDYVEAASTYRKLTELNPSSARAFSELGNILSVAAPGAPLDFDRARHAYLECTRLNREQSGPFLRLGLLDLNQGHAAAALDNFQIAAKFGSPEGQFWLAYTLFLQGKYQQAVQPLGQVLESYAKGRAIVGRGVLSEGDVLPAPDKPLTELEKAALKSILLLYWTVQRLGGYPAGIPQELRVNKPVNRDTELRPDTAGVEAGKRRGRAAWADFDKDGRVDLLVTGSTVPLALYRNQGNRFTDVTEAVGLKGIRNIWDATWVDYDQDGYPDLYLIRSGFVGAGQNMLYHNNRDGSFTDVTARMGLAGDRSTARACFADFDGDGRLDLLEVGASSQTRSSVRLFRNAGNHFVEETDSAGFASPGTAVDCAVGDYNRDGKPDVFVLFWHRDGILFANQGRGRFVDVTTQAGLQGVRDERFSALFFDYDRDGFLDLLVTSHAPFEEVARCLLQPNYKATQHTARLFRNNGKGSFEEVTTRVGLNRCYGTMQALAVDLDSDGWPDLIMVSGSLDAQRLEPSVVLRNMEGKGFREWFYVPRFETPANFVGAAMTDSNRNGAREIFFGGNPLLRDADFSPGLLVGGVSSGAPTNAPVGR